MRSYVAGHISMVSAHRKYRGEFERAYDQFRVLDGPDLAERAALWDDAENRGENIMKWFRSRQC
jgi:hypothetical protein